MADNEQTPWPPAPPEGKAQATKPAANNLAGWISLVMASIGVLLAAASVITLVLFGGSLDISGPVDIDLIWWGVVLVLGIIGRRSPPGKIGLGICVAALVFMAINFVWMVAHPAVAPVSAPTVPSVPSM